jgi:hypothetical protein
VAGTTTTGRRTSTRAGVTVHAVMSHNPLMSMAILMNIGFPYSHPLRETHVCAPRSVPPCSLGKNPRALLTLSAGSAIVMIKLHLI